jgi:hypothetical protein
MSQVENKSGLKGKKCFFITPIGEIDSDIRKRSDQVFKHLIKPSVEPFNYKPFRADQISEPGIITSQVIENVVESDLVIADLSGNNPNVFYELAIRHVIKKPYIQLIQEGETLPFDVAVTRTIRFNLADPDNVESAKNELAENVKKIVDGTLQVESPISTTLDLKAYRNSEKPIEQTLGELINTVKETNSRISTLESKFSPIRYSLSAPFYSTPSSQLLTRSGNDVSPKNLIREWDSIHNRYVWVDKDDTPSVFSGPFTDDLNVLKKLQQKKPF